MPLVKRFQTLFSSTWPRGDNQEFLNRVNKYAKKSQWKSLKKAFKAASEKVTPTMPQSSPHQAEWLHEISGVLHPPERAP